jgi:hypothetical protein
MKHVTTLVGEPLARLPALAEIDSVTARNVTVSSRRAAMGLFSGAAVIALGAGNVAARAPSVAKTEVANMVALRERWRALDGQTLAIEDRLATLKGAYLDIADVLPSGLAIRAADFRLLREFGSVARWKGLTHFTVSDIEAMRRRPAMRYTERFVAAGMSWKEMGTAAEVEPIGTLGIDYDIYRTRVPWPLAQRRKASIVAAHDRWQADNAALRVTMGVDDAEEVLEEHQDKVDAALEKVVMAPATTIAALQMKAGLMAEWHDDAEDPYEDWRTVVLVRSILEDIAKLRD